MKNFVINRDFIHISNAFYLTGLSSDFEKRPLIRKKTYIMAAKAMPMMIAAYSGNSYLAMFLRIANNAKETINQREYARSFFMSFSML